VDGVREVVRSADGTPIGLMTAGSGPPLLLVHGGLSGRSRFAPLWAHLAPHFRVTAMDRRGRGSSGDAAAYAFEREFEDVHAVASRLAANGSIDVFAHSIGGVVALGAAGLGAPLRRIALYEPPGPPTVPADWLDRLRTLIAADRPGPAIESFLTEVIGLTPEQVAAQREAPPGPEDVLAVASRTLVREGEALADVDLAALAAPVEQPVLLLHGSASPPWAAAVVRQLAAALRQVQVVELADAGHEGVDTAAQTVAEHLARFLGSGLTVRASGSG
jgi:pimeloyl-ACP methyl ester carboxylesterase